MSAHLVKLEDYRPQANADAVSVLEAALERARSGEIQAVAIAMIGAGSASTRVEISDARNYCEVLGVIDRLHRLCHKTIDEEVAE